MDHLLRCRSCVPGWHAARRGGTQPCFRPPSPSAPTWSKALGGNRSPPEGRTRTKPPQGGGVRGSGKRSFPTPRNTTTWDEKDRFPGSFPWFVSLLRTRKRTTHG